jgi:hypothetical protein
MIPTTMIRLLLRNASVDVGRLRSRHIFVAIVLVVSGDGQPATGSTPIDDHHDTETTTPNSSPNYESFRGNISNLFEDDAKYIQVLLNLEFNTEQYKETSESGDIFIPVVCKGLEKYFAVNDKECARTLAISDLGVSVYCR